MWYLLIVFFTLLCNSQDLRMIPSLGDARTGTVQAQQDLYKVDFIVKPPPGKHKGLTVVAWLRLTDFEHITGLIQLTTDAMWSAEPIQDTAPDLLQGAGGYAGEAVDLDTMGGVIAFSDVGFAPYSVDFSKWPNGVATIAGSSEQIITVSVGGNDVTVGAGAFNQNAIVGATDTVVISGAGSCNVGVSQTPLNKFSMVIDGVTIDHFFTPESIITNEFAMCTWRWQCQPDGNLTYRSDIGRIHAFDDLSQVKTNGTYQYLHSDGYYKVGLQGLRSCDDLIGVEMFDARVFGRYLEQHEMERVHANGVQELLRRGLVEW